MNKPILLLFSLAILALALALIPQAAAQTEQITDGLTNIWTNISSGASNIGSQISTFVSEQPLATGVMASTGTLAGVGAAGWKLASNAKNKLQSCVGDLSQKASAATGKASEVTQQLEAYKQQATTQLETYKQQASAATGQLSGIQSKLDETIQQKASLQNQVEEWQNKFKKLEIQNQELNRIIETKR